MFHAAVDAGERKLMIRMEGEFGFGVLLLRVRHPPRRVHNAARTDDATQRCEQGDSSTAAPPPSPGAVRRHTVKTIAMEK